MGLGFERIRSQTALLGLHTAAGIIPEGRCLLVKLDSWPFGDAVNMVWPAYQRSFFPYESKSFQCFCFSKIIIILMAGTLGSCIQIKHCISLTVHT